MDEFRAQDLFGMCPAEELLCPVCGKAVSNEPDENLLAWHNSLTAQQLSNAEWMHRSCVENQYHWLVLQRPTNDQPNLF